MIYIRPGAHVLELLELLSVAGEFPMSALSILGNQRTMRELVCKLEDKQEIEVSWSGKRYCARLLSISGKRGLMRNIRLHKSAPRSATTPSPASAGTSNATTESPRRWP